MIGFRLRGIMGLYNRVPFMGFKLMACGFGFGV